MPGLTPLERAESEPLDTSHLAGLEARLWEVRKRLDGNRVLLAVVLAILSANLLLHVAMAFTGWH